MTTLLKWCYSSKLQACLVARHTCLVCLASNKYKHTHKDTGIHGCTYHPSSKCESLSLLAWSQLYTPNMIKGTHLMRAYNCSNLTFVCVHVCSVSVCLSVSIGVGVGVGVGLCPCPCLCLCLCASMSVCLFMSVCLSDCLCE